MNSFKLLFNIEWIYFTFRACNNCLLHKNGWMSSSSNNSINKCKLCKKLLPISMYVKTKLDLSTPNLSLSIIVECTTATSCNAFSSKKEKILCLKPCLSNH